MGLDPVAIAAVQAIGAAVFLVLLLRLALLLGATPVGNLRQEILYLRGDVFRPLVRLGLAFLVLEAVQLLLPFLEAAEALRPGWRVNGGVLIDLAQAIVLAVLAIGTLRAFSPYSRRSLAEVEVLARRSVEAVARRVAPRQLRAGRR